MSRGSCISGGGPGSRPYLCREVCLPVPALLGTERPATPPGTGGDLGSPSVIGSGEGPPFLLVSQQFPVRTFSPHVWHFFNTLPHVFRGPWLDLKSLQGPWGLQPACRTGVEGFGLPGWDPPSGPATWPSTAAQGLRGTHTAMPPHCDAPNPTPGSSLPQGTGTGLPGTRLWTWWLPALRSRREPGTAALPSHPSGPAGRPAGSGLPSPAGPATPALSLSLEGVRRPGWHVKEWEALKSVQDHQGSLAGAQSPGRGSFPNWGSGRLGYVSPAVVWGVGVVTCSPSLYLTLHGVRSLHREQRP